MRPFPHTGEQRRIFQSVRLPLYDQEDRETIGIASSQTAGLAILNWTRCVGGLRVEEEARVAD